MLAGKVLVAQGGGPTAVINQSLAGVVVEARKVPAVERVYGGLHGVRGIIDEDLVDLTQETTHNLEAVADTPSSALGSTRDKPDLKYCQEIFRVLQAHEISTFFYIGGNDSSDTLRIVSEEARSANYRLRCIHIPKTVDNDLVINDHCPGYPSAARFVASAFAGINLDNWALPGVYLGVVMGRHAGFLTAASSLGQKYPDDGPHLIYMPERVFEIDRFLADVKKQYETNGRCIIAVSEGIHDKSGEPIITQLAEQVERDAHGNVQLSGTGALADLLTDLVKSKLGIKRVRGDTLGYMQRSFLGLRVRRRPARGTGGWRKGGPIRPLAGRGRVGDDPPHGLLLGGIPFEPADRRCRQNQDHAGRVHLRRRHAHHRRVPAVSAPAAGIRHAKRLPAAQLSGGQDPAQRNLTLHGIHALQCPSAVAKQSAADPFV